MHRLRLLLALFVLAASAAGGSALAAGGGARPSASADRGAFATPCGFSHRAPDDPIVAPGRPAASHSHDFFGNVSTGAHSTAASLARAGTTCRRPEDRAAYWVPTLYEGDRAVRPLGAQIYLRAAGKAARSIHAHPAGLRIIAGDARAEGPQPVSVASWHCGPPATPRAQAEVPSCPTGSALVLRLRFPDCWNGRDLDSADHRGHMAYARRGACPASHPVAVPLLAVNVRYPVTGGPAVRLASGAPHTAHADFLNAWDQRELERLVHRCVNTGLSPEAPPCRASAMRVSVAPRRLAAGRKATVRLRVTTARDGRRTAVRGAPVTLAGKRSRTDVRGRARLRVRIARPGRYLVRVRGRAVPGDPGLRATRR